MRRDTECHSAFSSNLRKYGPEKLPIGTLFAQCNQHSKLYKSVFGKYDKVETQICYLLGKFNITLLLKSREVFGNKTTNIVYKEMLPLAKRCLEFFFSHSLEK